jgi:hypothetical protein
MARKVSKKQIEKFLLKMIGYSKVMEAASLEEVPASSEMDLTGTLLGRLSSSFRTYVHLPSIHMSENETFSVRELEDLVCTEQLNYLDDFRDEILAKKHFIAIAGALSDGSPKQISDYFEELAKRAFPRPHTSYGCEKKNFFINIDYPNFYTGVVGQIQRNHGNKIVITFNYSGPLVQKINDAVKNVNDVSVERAWGNAFVARYEGKPGLQKQRAIREVVKEITRYLRENQFYVPDMSRTDTQLDMLGEGGKVRIRIRFTSEEGDKRLEQHVDTIGRTGSVYSYLYARHVRGNDQGLQDIYEKYNFKIEKE